MEKGFVFLDEVIPGIRWDAKYATWDNFTGKPVDGYEVNRIVVAKEMVDALAAVKKEADEMGYGLLVWDAYRPQRAVNCFLKWASQPEDGKTKTEHYPNIKREELISMGYVAAKSSHSRGSAIDLTLYSLKTKEILEMGTCFDFMDVRSHHTCETVSKEELENRQILRGLMTRNGFVDFENEWWHYNLKEEPYPDTYFDFPISGNLEEE